MQRICWCVSEAESQQRCWPADDAVWPTVYRWKRGRERPALNQHSNRVEKSWITAELEIGRVNFQHRALYLIASRRSHPIRLKRKTKKVTLEEKKKTRESRKALLPLLSPFCRQNGDHFFKERNTSVSRAELCYATSPGRHMLPPQNTNRQTFRVHKVHWIRWWGKEKSLKWICCQWMTKRREYHMSPFCFSALYCAQVTVTAL